VVMFRYKMWKVVNSRLLSSMLDLSLMLYFTF
jgi:hypothetical protein